MPDAALMMQYDANEKSVAIAYLLWFFLGLAGAHRFYLGETGTAAALPAITGVSILLMVVLIGFFTIAISGTWVLIDLFLIPGMARRYNANLAMRLNVARG